ncbi:hypothetical protein GCM10027594_03460 [Hymenobacter agri]
MKNYLQTIRLAFPRELVRHLAARLGERESAVSKALKGMVPVVLCQMVIRIGDGGGRELFAPIVKPDWPGIRNIRNQTEVLALLGSGPSHSAALRAGEQMLSQLFGTGRAEMEMTMGAYAQIRPASVISLLQLVIAVVAAGLGQFATRQQFSAARLGEELGTAKNKIYNWLPADMPRWPGFRRRAAVESPHAVWAAELARPYWVLVLMVAGAAVLALLVLGALANPAGRGGGGLLATVAADSVHYAPVTRPDTAAAALPYTISLPVTW